MAKKPFGNLTLLLSCKNRATFFTIKCFSSSQKIYIYIYIFKIALNVESTFKIEIVLIDKTEQLTKQKVSPSRKLNLEDRAD